MGDDSLICGLGDEITRENGRVIKCWMDFILMNKEKNILYGSANMQLSDVSPLSLVRNAFSEPHA